MVLAVVLSLLFGPFVGNVLAQDRGRFHYNAKTGACENDLRQTGLNPVTRDEIQKTGDGECADLRFQLNGDNLSYPILKDWNLKGASLDKAKLFFAHLLDADLRGARLEGFEFGYAEITGLIDEFTKLPGGERARHCTVEDADKLSPACRIPRPPAGA